MASTPSIVPGLTEVTTAAVAIQLGSVCGSFMATAIANGVPVLKIVRRLLGTPDNKRGSEGWATKAKPVGATHMRIASEIRVIFRLQFGQPLQKNRSEFLERNSKARDPDRNLT
jgi:hypothetical protein